MTINNYLLLGIFSICILASCQRKKSVDSYIDEYQIFQDTLSNLQKEVWALENDSIRYLKKEKYTELIHALSTLDSLSLTVDDLINKELLMLEMENELNDIEFGTHLLPLNSEGGFLTGIIYNLQYAQTQSAKDKENYIKMTH